MQNRTSCPVIQSAAGVWPDWREAVPLSSPCLNNPIALPQKVQSPKRAQVNASLDDGGHCRSSSPFRHELPEFDFRHKNTSITKDKCASYIGKWYNISIPLPVVLLEESSHGRWRVDVIYPEKTALSSTIWWIYSSGFAMWRRHHSACPGEEEMNHSNTSERRKK